MFLAALWDGLRGLANERGRALSSVLGVAWGTFAVVGLQAFGIGLEESMALRAQGMGEAIVVAWPSRTTLPWRGVPEGRGLHVSADDVRALPGDVPEIAAVSPEYGRSLRMRRGTRVFRPQVTGVDPVYGELRNLVPEPGGRFFGPRDLAERRRVVFLGDKVARQLFPDEEAVRVAGAELVLGGTPFTVIGVMRPKDQDSNYGSIDDERVFVPASTFEQVFGARYVSNLVYRAKSRELLPRAIDGVYASLGRRLGFDPDDRAAIDTWDTTEGDQIRGRAFQSMNVMTFLAGLFTLLVGTLGVGNLMYLLVKRRTGEIGIRLALGTPPRSILVGFLAETLVLVAAGGALGFLAAIGLAELVAATPAVEKLGHARVSPTLGAGVVALLFGVALAAGWFPARRAARLDPVLALRSAG